MTPLLSMRWVREGAIDEEDEAQELALSLDLAASGVQQEEDDIAGWSSCK